MSKVKSQHAPHLLDSGGCSLHYIHIAISYTIDAFGEELVFLQGNLCIHVILYLFLIE